MTRSGKKSTPKAGIRSSAFESDALTTRPKSRYGVRSVTAELLLTMKSLDLRMYTAVAAAAMMMIMMMMMVMTTTSKTTMVMMMIVIV